MSYSITSSEDNCYPGTTVLVNKLNLHKQEALNKAEKIAVSLRSIEVENSACSEAFNFNFYCSVHKQLFGDIYDWAGELRAVDISKKGTAFCPAKDIQQLGNALFKRLHKENYFIGLGREEYISHITEFYHDLNMLHPFREGNGRTQRLFFTLLIRRAGYNIDFAALDLDELLIATIYAAQGISNLLYSFFDKAIC
jgi:cell filamentation protein